MHSALREQTETPTEKTVFCYIINTAGKKLKAVTYERSFENETGKIRGGV